MSYSTNSIVVDSYPLGYGRVAAFEDCDPSFLISRKFGRLHSRVLLHLQDEVQELEEKLEALDNTEYSSGDPLRPKNRRIDFERRNAPRKALLIEIGAKLAEYGETYDLRSSMTPLTLSQTKLFYACKKNKPSESQPNETRIA